MLLNRDVAPKLFFMPSESQFVVEVMLFVNVLNVYEMHYMLFSRGLTFFLLFACRWNRRRRPSFVLLNGSESEKFSEEVPSVHRNT